MWIRREVIDRHANCVASCDGEVDWESSSLQKSDFVFFCPLRGAAADGTNISKLRQCLQNVSAWMPSYSVTGPSVSRIGSNLFGYSGQGAQRRKGLSEGPSKVPHHKVDLRSTMFHLCEALCPGASAGNRRLRLDSLSDLVEGSA